MTPPGSNVLVPEGERLTDEEVAAALGGRTVSSRRMMGRPPIARYRPDRWRCRLKASRVREVAVPVRVGPQLVRGVGKFVVHLVCRGERELGFALNEATRSAAFPYLRDFVDTKRELAAVGYPVEITAIDEVAVVPPGGAPPAPGSKPLAALRKRVARGLRLVVGPETESGSSVLDDPAGTTRPPFASGDR